MTDAQKIEALRDALRAAVDAVIDEIQASGIDEDDLEANPMFRGHLRIAERGREVLKATRPGA
jgi:hypothetical protein